MPYKSVFMEKGAYTLRSGNTSDVKTTGLHRGKCYYKVYSTCTLALTQNVL